MASHTAEDGRSLLANAAVSSAWKAVLMRAGLNGSTGDVDHDYARR